MRFAYNTNGLQNHRLEDAVALVADAGYDGLALTLDIHHLDPYAPDLRRRAEALRRTMEQAGVPGAVIETGARFLLDPRLKHEPTLLSPSADGRRRRVEFLARAVAVADVLGAECVSFWAGVPRPGVAPEDAWRWLREGVLQVLDVAAAHDVRVALEPEPGMLVETVDDWARFRAGLGGADLPIALDVGHLLVTGERDPAAAVHELAGSIGTVTVEDMRRGEHVHLPFGEGDLDLPPVLGALEAIGWDGLVCVELSRESHRAHELVPASRRALQDALELSRAGSAPARPRAASAP